MNLASNRLGDGLSSIRFYGAISMLCIHVVIFLMLFGFKTPSGLSFVDGSFTILGFYNMKYSIVFSMGERIIKLFFVLSGFLLSYQFFQNTESLTIIKVKHYFTNRAKRILPLYFFMILIWFFILPRLSFFTPHQELVANYNHYFEKLLCYFLLSPHAIDLFTENLPYAQVAWSVGVECWFYIVLPLFFLLPNKTACAFSIGINVVYVLFMVLQNLGYLDIVLLGSTNAESQKFFIQRLSVFDFSIGALCAWLVVKHKSFTINFLFNKPVQLFSFISAILLIFVCNTNIYSLIGLSALLGVIIMNVASNEQVYFPLKRKWIVKGGDYAYSIYLWHPIAIYINMAVAERYFHVQVVSVFIFFLLLLGSIFSTIFVATISYRFIEKPFLKKRINHV
ncbi:MAG: acyltransferase [Chitinophagales bacterium]